MVALFPKTINLLNMQKLILLIDNDKEEFLILKEAIGLARLSHICAWADSIERAEQLLKHMLPDLILVDYNMPKCNGIACLERLRSIDLLRNVEIVMYSNYVTDINHELTLSNGESSIQKTGSLVQLAQYFLKITAEQKYYTAKTKTG